MFRKFTKTDWKWFSVCAIPTCALLMAAGVNGIFNHVTSATGYQVNGTAGASGTALCSDGTNYVNSCTIPGGTIYYQTVQEAGTGLTQQPILNFDGTVVASNGSGKTNVGLPNTGTAGTYANPSSITTDAQGRVTSVTAQTVTNRTCNGAGCYKIFADGTIVEWVNTPAPNNSVASVTLPFSIPNAVLSINCTDNGTRVQGGNDQAVGANVAGQSAPFASFAINSPATSMNAYCTIWGD